MAKKVNKDFTILVVDDEAEIRNMIKDYLSDSMGYTVVTAVDGLDALDNVLPENKIDLVLSDINMPRMKGFELLNKVKEIYPEIKRVLITAFNVEDYFEYAIEHDVGNIFVKTTPFNFEELSTILTNLLTNDIFGAKRYMEKNAELNTIQVMHVSTLEEVAQKVTSWLPPGENVARLELVLIELLSNAVYYGIRGEPPDKKETWNHDFTLSKEEAIKIKVYKDSKKFAISILDKGGKLKKQDVLYWLHRQISKDEKGLPLGIMDSHGRGFFIVRKYIDRLLINIDTNKKTEVIIINYFDKVYSGYKPLYINEI
jgi:YesN/AraC family two-component response regulator